MSKSNFDREYLGVTITSQNYREILEKEGRYGINFHTKHLKSYLRGDKTFNYDYERNEEGRILTDKFGFAIPKVHRVQQKLTDLRTLRGSS